MMNIIECLLVTANCGSVFEDPSRLLENWIKEFLSHVEQCKPKFIALHLQEVGGKTYEKSLEYVQQFIKILCESTQLKEYSKIRVYLDEDYNSAEHFTALGNLYFAHNLISDLKIWNFSTHEFENVEGKSIHTGNIESIETKQKAKFPQQFFPECKWSRKGYLRTRWDIEGTTLDLINIHLFHDANNLSACEQYPSVYCKSRRRALAHTLELIHKDQDNKLVPFFIFGDFNFRCDTDGVIKMLTMDLTEQRIPHLKTDSSKVMFRDSDGNIQLTVGKKEFTHIDHQIFKKEWLKEFDRELEPLKDILCEFPINFSPTYPYEENPQLPHHYMSTRCPSWCDRILMTKAAKNLMPNEENVEYGIIGSDTCMGDHKPVYLKLCIKPNQGIVYKCDHVEIKRDFSKKREANLKDNCELCLLQLDNIIREYNSPLSFAKCTLNKNHMPLVSINVVDEDSLNICLCKSGLMVSNNVQQIANKQSCSSCKYLPNEQPMMISKQVVIGDVIVNRIDSHYLSSTYSSSPSQLRKLRDPYTPESLESHSPQPEMDGEKEFPDFINETNDDDEIMIDVVKFKTEHTISSSNDETDNKAFQNHMYHSVSPSQLQTRLEILRRESQLECDSANNGSGLSYSNDKKSMLGNKCCLCCSSCAIL